MECWHLRFSIEEPITVLLLAASDWWIYPLFAYAAHLEWLCHLRLPKHLLLSLPHVYSKPSNFELCCLVVQHAGSQTHHTVQMSPAHNPPMLCTPWRTWLWQPAVLLSAWVYTFFWVFFSSVGCGPLISIVDRRILQQSCKSFWQNYWLWQQMS